VVGFGWSAGDVVCCQVTRVEESGRAVKVKLPEVPPKVDLLPVMSSLLAGYRVAAEKFAGGTHAPLARFQRHCGTSDEHAIADLICDLGHLADERGFDFLDEVKRGIGHWYAECHVSDRNYLGPDAAVEITVTPR
jgi:hypothetical protein